MMAAPPVAVIAAVVMAALSIGAAHARAAQPVPATPPVLSTSPTPPAGAMPDASQMSGLPLQVGDLPPGVVAVRVIRRSFANNVSGQDVELHLGSGKVVKVSTNNEGRAQFNGLRVGDTVLVRAVVDAEPLGSQRFELPAQGGVRLVLVAGVGAGVPADTAPLVSQAPAAAGPVAAAAPPAPRRSQIAVPLILAFALGGAGFVWFTRRPRPALAARAAAAVAAAPPSRATLAAHRAVVFDRLVRLEQERAAGRVGEEYVSSRERLVGELMVLDVALDDVA